MVVPPLRVDARLRPPARPLGRAPSLRAKPHVSAVNSTRMEPISSSNPLVQYKLLRQVGKGSYGKVYRALERSTNATLAAQPVNRVPASGDGSYWLLRKARSAPNHHSGAS